MGFNSFCAIGDDSGSAILRMRINVTPRPKSACAWMSHHKIIVNELNECAKGTMIIISVL